MSQVSRKLTRFVVNGLRVHYKEKGQGERKVCLLGEPPWPYLSRKIIPLLSHDQWVIAMEKVGRLPCTSRMGE